MLNYQPRSSRHNIKHTSAVNVTPKNIAPRPINIAINTLPGVNIIDKAAIAVISVPIIPVNNAPALARRHLYTFSLFENMALINNIASAKPLYQSNPHCCFN